MLRSGLQVVGLATLVVLAGCSGVFGTPTPTDSTPPSNSSSSDSSLQELENASVWIGGTVARVENNTLYINTSQYNDVVIPVSMEEGTLFHCQSNGSSCQPVELREVQQGQEVCAFVRIETGTVVPVKVFFNAVCTWQHPQQ